MNDNEIQHIPLIGEMLPTMQVQTTHGPKPFQVTMLANGSYFLVTQQISPLFVPPSSSLSKRITTNSAP